MLAVNESIIADSVGFYGYNTPTDFRLEERHPQLFPTNVRPETLRQDAELKHLAAEGKLPKAQFLRFTSPLRTPIRRTIRSTRAGIPRHRKSRRQAQASHPGHAAVECGCLQSQCAVHPVQSLWNFGAATQQTLPRHSSPRGTGTVRLCRQLKHWTNAGRVPPGGGRYSQLLDWLQQQGYEQFGVLGTSLGSCYAFIAALTNRACGSTPSTMHRYGPATWCGPARAPPCSRRL